jgi:hypothetical protein
MQRIRKVILVCVLASCLVAASRDSALAEEPADLAPALEAVAAEAAAPESEPEPLAAAEVDALIEQLDSNQYLTRERATQSLLNAKLAAIDPLLAAANGERPEPADRAVWILRKFADSDDHEVALAALDRLVRLKNRPTIVQEASLARAQFYEVACREKLAKLGAQLTVVETVLPEHGLIRLIQINLTEKWTGTNEDLKCLADLSDHRFFRIDGAAADDGTAKLFEDMENLALIQLVNTQVTLDAVNAIKERRPKAVVYVKNRALLGIVGVTNPQGVLVSDPRAGLGAANAGIVAGDIITHIDGEGVKDFDRLTARVAQYDPGKEIEVTLMRGKEKLTKKVTLSDWATQGQL